MQYTLRQIEIFLAIAEYENITKAANSLHLSQSAASSALQALEKNHDRNLFDRKGKKLKLSHFGHQLRADAQALISHAKEFEQRLHHHQPLGDLHVGASYTIANHLVVNYLSQYLKHQPQANVDLDVGSTPAIIAQVLNYEIDLGMVEAEVVHQDLKLIPWREDELIVFCSPHHPLAKKGTLTDTDIKQARWILRESDSAARNTFDKALSGLISEMDIFLEFKQNQAIKQAVEAGLGIGCLSEIVLQENLERGDLVPLTLPNRNMRRQFYFALAKNRYHQSSVDLWLKICQRSLQSAHD